METPQKNERDPKRDQSKMILRSSSSPILSSLLSSSSSPHHFNESPNNNYHHLEKSSSLPSSSFLHPPKPSCSFHISPLPDSSPTQKPSSIGFRRAQSEGNLQSLNPILDSIPSFSVYSSNGQQDEFDEEEKEKDQFDDGRGVGEGFSFVGQNQDQNLVENCGDIGGYNSHLPLFLARGLGIDRIGSGLLNAGGGDGNGNGDGNEWEKSEIEMYYRRMVDENPSDALFLSNYAQFLYQSKGDAKRAEEYYSRAILAEPGDGEILSQYAKLVWELYHDKERASSYFDQAVHATPNDSNVLAAFASFLWETDDDDGADGNYQEYSGIPIHHEILA